MSWNIYECCVHPTFSDYSIRFLCPLSHSTCDLCIILQILYNNLISLSFSIYYFLNTNTILLIYDIQVPKVNFEKSVVFLFLAF